MAINPVELEAPIIYDFDQMCKLVDNPALAAKWAKKDILFQLSRMGLVSNPNAISKPSIAAAEITKDIVTHADESEPRLVILQPELGGAALHSLSVEGVNKAGDDDEVADPFLDEFIHNGEKLLEGMYKADYKLVRGDDGEFERHLFIRGDVDVELPRIHHDN
ncbi:MAG: hypothetical protein NTV39_01690 [Candidatus Saccharibacteria bacterium]|nr:hypothetical protein [Candidatus Saccharibacteria bacterium]